jgi:hypothetical protein
MAASDHTHALVITEGAEPELREVSELDESEGRKALFVVYGREPEGLLAWAALWQTYASEQHQAHVLLDALSPERTLGPAAAEQLRLNAAARAEFLDRWPSLRSAEVADLVGSAAANRNAAAHKLLRKGQLFAVRYRGQDFYPSFQFDVAEARPRPVIARALGRLQAAGLRGWEIAFWFTDPNGWLDDSRPVDLLQSDPDAVAAAAEHETDPLPE